MTATARSAPPPTLKVGVIHLLAACVLTGLATAALRADEPDIRSRVAADKRLSVAVLPFADDAGDPNLAHYRYVYTGLLRNQLGEVEAVRLVSEKAVKYALRQARLSAGDRIDPNQARLIGEYIEAQRVISGSYSKRDNRWHVDLRVTNVATGAVSPTARAMAEGWFDVRDRLAGQVLAELGVTATAEERQKMAQRWTHSAEALDWYAEGYLAQEQGRPAPQLEACFRKAIAFDPNCARAYGGLGAVLATQGKFDLAEDAAQKALGLDPDAASIHAVLGWVYAAQNQLDRAKASFRRACQLDPDDADYLTVLAEIFMQEGKWDEATAFLETAVSLDRTNAKTHAALAKAYAVRQRDDEAVRELEEANLYLSEGMYAANALWPMAEAYERLGNRSEALASYERALALAKELAVRPDMIRAIEGRIQRVKNALKPTFIDASIPRRHTEAELDAALRGRLTAAEQELVTHPFKCTDAMTQWAQELTAGAATDIEKAKALFDALAARLHVPGQPKSRTAREVFQAWNDAETRLVCMDLAVLFTALARAVDVNAFFVDVTKLPDGKVVNHACAAVLAGNRTMLVDPSLRWFGVPHQHYSILNDLETTAFLCFNNTGGDPKELAMCRAGLKLWPDSVQAHLTLVGVLCRAGRVEEARRVFGDMIEPQTSDYDAAVYRRLQGLFAEDDGDWKRAEAHLIESISIYPSQPDARFALGRVYLRQGRPADARTALRACLRHSPDPKAAAIVRHLVAQINEKIGIGPILDAVESLIQRAGNADADETRLGTLKELRSRPDLEETLRADLDRMIEEIERWTGVKETRLDYFGREVSRGLDYDFDIAGDSPLYPLTHIYRGRMVTWYALESGGVWRNVQRKREFLDTARRCFERAAEAFPQNRIVRMYLGEPIPAEKVYPAVAGAPAWAVHQREGLERLTDVIEWWIDHRMQEDGQYGGGWGDDCEMWRFWTPILIGFESAKINQAQARFSEALLSQPHMKLGYTTRMSDVEHTAEDSADAITPMMHIDPDNPAWNQRALRLVELMESLWTGRNQRGFLQFKSTYFTAEKVDLTPARACDTVYHPRTVQPALLYWQRTADERLTALFADWMETWVNAAARAERGKPAGIIPSAIHWPEGTAGGTAPHWWDPRNHGEHTLYLFPSAMSMMTHTLLLTYHMTGQEKYLEPLRSMAKARLAYLDSPPKDDPAPGSRAWCAARLGGLVGLAAKYKSLTASTEFDGLLAREMPPYLRYRLAGDIETLAAALRQNAEALAVNTPGYTSEVRYTDRVLRFPSLFSSDGIVKRAVPSVGSPNPSLLYSSVTGDPGTPGYFPLNAIRWLTPPRDIAALVTEASRNSLVAELFHFGDQQRSMAAEFYLLAPGPYVLSVTVGGPNGPVEKKEFEVAGPRSRVAFTLPPQTLCRLRIELLRTVPKVHAIHEARHVADDADNAVGVAIPDSHAVHAIGAVLEVHAVHEGRHVAKDAADAVAVPVVQQPAFPDQVGPEIGGGK